MDHHHLHTQRKDTVVSGITQTIFSFRGETRIFLRDTMSRNFSHFSRKRVNAFPDIEEKDHKLELYKDKLLGLFDHLLGTFEDLKMLKSCIIFLVNPFMIGVISTGFPNLRPLLIESSPVLMELKRITGRPGCKDD